MEVRTTDSHAALGELRPPSPDRDAEISDSHLGRIASTAAAALDIPVACVYIVDESVGTACYGLRDDGLEEYLGSIFNEGEETEPVIIGPHNGTSGGDGAALQSIAAFPISGPDGVAGFFCAADYKARLFTPRDIDLMKRFADLIERDLDRLYQLRFLEQSEQRFRAVTENALDTIAIVSREGTFRYLSHSSTVVMGIDPHEGVGRSVYEGILKADARELEKSFAQAEDDGGTMSVEFRYVHPDGGLRHLRLSGRNLLSRDGVEGYLVHIRDATDRVHFEQELRKSRDQAEEMNRLKSVFLTNMSHEIRTPLTTILGFAEILEDEVGEEEREFVHLIQQGGQRLMDTLMSILDLARLESSSFDIDFEEFDVAQKIWETCLLMEPLAQEKGIYLKVNMPDEPVQAVLDVSAVERVVSNLVSNGLKFTSEGGVTLTIEADEDHVLIHVEDTGIGISEEFMPFLFDEFKQESEGLSRIHEGSGLGLPITKRLVELMKGKVMADSQKGAGSVFTVALPRNGESAAGADNGTEDVGGKPRVLVVEDNADTRTLVNHLLRKNYEVVLASDGEEALELAAQSKYDALLVDINLGKGKSGEEVLHAIKELDGYADTPIVAVTAYAMPGDRERFFSEGFDDYVSKPFSKQRLLEALEGVLD